MVAAVMGAATLAAGAYSAHQQKGAINDASAVQQTATQQGIDETNKRFEALQKLLQPYVTAGNQSMMGQQDILGLNGQGAQQAAVNGVQNSAQFGAMAQQGEDAILQNASATGGLRGGNVQAALGQFRPQLLNQLLDQQYARLGGLTQIGQASAVGVGAGGQQAGTQIAGLYGQQGASQAGALLGGARTDGQFANTALGALGTYQGLGGFGGSTPPPQRPLGSAANFNYVPAALDTNSNGLLTNIPNKF